jgi:hypothetical protein
LPANLDDWLTVHRSITLVDLQLDAQNSYLFTYNRFISEFKSDLEDKLQTYNKINGAMENK